MFLFRFVSTGAALLASAASATAQAPAGSLVRLEIENFTIYIQDCPNSQLAKTTDKLDRVKPANPCPPEYQTAIRQAFAHFGMLPK
jgi:hypothetical protein